MTFVKSAKTSASAVNSRSGIDKMLRRYGATAISMQENIEHRQIIVGFVIPDSTAKGAAKVPVRLPISITKVYRILYPYDGSYFSPSRMEQAERVAWRNLYLWIDAALSAATMGLQTITEAFFAHAVVGAGGERMIEVVEAHQQALGGGVQKLLTAEAST